MSKNKICKICGSNLKLLFSSFYCPYDCNKDRKINKLSETKWYAFSVAYPHYEEGSYVCLYQRGRYPVTNDLEKAILYTSKGYSIYEVTVKAVMSRSGYDGGVLGVGVKIIKKVKNG